ncbi:uncharacterized protein [Miscanthus floridulus]|uniref:uncharacterized protein n=1 Tax=Miscanthus floridulus TaxID=154761 RepID=UPI003458B2B9
MLEAPNKRNTLASLMEDIIFEILHRLLVLLQMCLLLLENLISDPNNHKKLPQTMAGFFYDSENGNRNLTNIVRGIRSYSLEFLPFNIENVAVLDCCNGLILCWCLGADGYHYVICNPMT